MLLSTYMKDSSPPYSALGYNKWIVNSVQNQYIKVLNQLTFGTLEREGLNKNIKQNMFQSIQKLLMTFQKY